MMSKTFEYICEILAKEGRVELRNFGVFEVAVRKPRVSRNPKTGEVFHVPKRYGACKKAEILLQIKNIEIK